MKKDSSSRYATVVHCDTPSGVINDVAEISRIVDRYGIMTVADSVPLNDITGPKQALDNFFADNGVYERHTKIAAATRYALEKGGLKISCDFADVFMESYYK